MAPTEESLGFSQLPPAVQQQLDSICDRFEAAWSDEQRPELGDYLASVPELNSKATWRSALFQELLRVDVEFRRQIGQTPLAEEYAADFPEYAELIQREFSRPARVSRRPQATIMAAGEATETTAATRSEAPVSAMPATIGRYQVLSHLGSGSFGVVYRAYDPQLDREVALKVPQQDLINVEGFRSRLLREARAAATVSHPNICQLYEINEINGTPILVCAYITGQTLAERLQEGWLTSQQAAAFVRRVALALAEAHRRGVVHRDLKPANLMIDQRGEPVVMDFGLARRSGTADTQLTKQGDVLGTPAYMSPEQARGETEAIGPAADIYSLGAILYELISGRPPATGNALQALKQIRAGRIAPPGKLIPNVDPDLEAICLKAMSFRAADRYATMAEFAQALADYLKTSPGKSAGGVSRDSRILTRDSQLVKEPTADKAAVASAERRRFSLAGRRLSRLELGLLLLATLQTPVVLYFLFGVASPATVSSAPLNSTDLTPHLGVWFLEDGWDLELEAGGIATLTHSYADEAKNYRFYTGTYQVVDQADGRPQRVTVTIRNPTDPLFRDDRIELFDFREHSAQLSYEPLVQLVQIAKELRIGNQPVMTAEEVWSPVKSPRLQSDRVRRRPLFAAHDRFPEQLFPAPRDTRFTQDELILQGSVNNVLDVLRNDLLPGEPPSSLQIETFDEISAAGGIVKQEERDGRPVFLYTPPAGPTPDAEYFSGVDLFTYQLSNLDAEQITRFVQIRVSKPGPLAMDDTFTMFGDFPGNPAPRPLEIKLDVLANDFRADALPVRITSVSQPEGKMAPRIVLRGSELWIAPPPAFAGEVAFTYTISDDDPETQDATARVTVRVEDQPPAPEPE